jgi:hypothetical protein
MMSKEQQNNNNEKEAVQPPGEIIEEKPKSMMERMKEIEDLMKSSKDMESSKTKKKAFKFPGRVKRQTRNLKKLMEKNRIQAIILKRTGGIQPVIAELNKGTIIVGNHYWTSQLDYVWFWNGTIPTALLPEWDMQPVTMERLIDDTKESKTWMDTEIILMDIIKSKMSSDAIKGGKIKPMTLVIIGIVAVIAGYVLFGGGA